MSDLDKKKLTFLAKNETICPVCEGSFQREELLSGGGRMIAGKLDWDLRRHYEPSKKFGEVFPLIYYVTVCPHCLYAAFPQDFPKPEPKNLEKLQDESERRQETVGLIFPDLDFTEPRTLREGAASYLLSLECYGHFHKNTAPSLKRAIAALRGAWCFEDLHRKYPGENYDYLAKILFHKSRFFYSLVVEREVTGEESVGNIQYFGPDLDKNFGYDGVLYMAGYLEYRHGNHEDEENRRKSLQYARQTLARIVGMGKSSKSKPSALLDMARDMHHEMGEEIKQMDQAQAPEADEL